MGNVLENFGTVLTCMAEIHYMKDTHHMTNVNILPTGLNNLSVVNVYFIKDQ